MLGRVYDGRMVDVWSTGCSLFVMLAGAFPFLQVCPCAISAASAGYREAELLWKPTVKLSDITKLSCQLASWRSVSGCSAHCTGRRRRFCTVSI